MTKQCELWFSEKENSHIFFPTDEKNPRPSLPADAELVWTIKASSWKDACQKRNDFLGWGPYVPMAGESESW